MKYVVYEHREPIKSERKGKDNRNVYEANIVERGVLDVPQGKCPIDHARDKYGIDHPLVRAVNGYTEKGKVRLYL